MKSASPTYQPPPSVCNACFDVGKTPNFLLCFFSGIQRGALFNPGDPDPPNYLHTASVIAPCEWETLVTDFTVNYKVDALDTNVTLINAVVGSAFTARSAGQCHIWLANDLINPAIRKYYGGWCMVVPPLVGGSWSYPELLALLSDDPEWAQFLNVHPDAGSVAFYNLYKGNSEVNIKIKIDHS